MTPAEVHALFMGQEPNVADIAFYDSGKLGFSDKTFNKDRLLPVTILSIQKTMRSGLKTPSQVVIFVPPHYLNKVIAQLKDFSVIMYRHLMKKRPGDKESRIALANIMAKYFRVLFINPRLLQLPE